MNVIAKLGENPYFIAFMAHCWFAFAIVAFLPHWWVVGVCVVLAAAKEFLFDPTQEDGQTPFDDVTDFLGYLIGLTLGAWKFI